MKEVKLEYWTSSENNQEMHFFTKDTNEYVLGFNPKYIELSQIHMFLKLHGLETDDFR